jgi:hypothetical protein
MRTLAFLTSFIAAACGARSTLDVPRRSDAGTPSDAGPPPADAFVPDAGTDAGEIECELEPGWVGAWRVPGEEDGSQIPALFHVTTGGTFSVDPLSTETGSAYGMGVAARGSVVGASWRVRKPDGANELYFAITSGGCLAEDPLLLASEGTIQTFRGNVVATSSGWLVFWVGEGGLFARAVSADGTTAQPTTSISSSSDARFSLASDGDRVGIVYVDGGSATDTMRIREVTASGALIGDFLVARATSILEPRIVASERGWAGAYLQGGALWIYAMQSDGTVPSLRAADACSACTTEPSYVLPSVAAGANEIGVLFGAGEGGSVRLHFVRASTSPFLVGDVLEVSAGDDLRWPSLGSPDGISWMAVYGEGDRQVVAAQIREKVAVELSRTRYEGFQRLPFLVLVP